MAEIVIRQALAEDVPVVRGLMLAYGNYLASNPGGAANICIENYERELQGLPGQYSSPSGTLLLALVDGLPAGCCGVRTLRKDRVGERGCELKRLWVDGAFRGLRLGRRLMDVAIAWATEAGYEAMYLDTVPAAMPEANAMYAAMGFERVERYNNNLVEDVIFFRLALGTPQDMTSSMAAE
jgi:GNAT superfamily N-acetyltransferase